MLVRGERSGRGVAIFRRLALILTAAALLLGSLLASHELFTFTAWLHALIALSVIAGLLGAASVCLWRRVSPSRGWLWGVALAALVFRLIAMGGVREVSDDAARYHWDGKVLAHGINPYRHAPDDPAVAHLRGDALDARINHPHLPTVYPPVAELCFAVAYQLSPGRLLGFHLLALLAELLTWLLLARELDRRACQRAHLLLLAWSPLVILESYVPGHADILALPLLTLFILHLDRGRPWIAGGFLALAVLIKPFPLIFLPAACAHLGWRRSVPFMLALAAVGVGMYVPFIGAGERLFSSMALMAREWSFGGSLGALADAVLPPAVARPLLGGLLAVLTVAAARWGRGLVAKLLLASAAWVICTPTLFPWYLIGLYPLLVLRPDPALAALCLLAPLSEEVIATQRATGAWAPAMWPRLVQYGAFYALLIWGAVRRWGMFTPIRTSRSDRPSVP